ncbi:unnamed protein product [[Candida] boidinii]|nr:unnamed protein product [[Candida] boidinii]
MHLQVLMLQTLLVNNQRCTTNTKVNYNKVNRDNKVNKASNNQLLLNNKVPPPLKMKIINGNNNSNLLLLHNNKAKLKVNNNNNHLNNKVKPQLCNNKL